MHRKIPLPELRVQSVRLLPRKHLVSPMQGRQSILDLRLITGFTCLKAKRVHYTPKTPFSGAKVRKIEERMFPLERKKIRNPSLCLNCGFLKITFFVAINCLKLYHSLPVLPKRSFMNRFTEAILSSIGLSSRLWNSISMQRKHPRKQSTPQSH